MQRRSCPFLVLVGGSHAVAFFFTGPAKTLVFQVGVTASCHRFTGSLCAVEGVAVAAVFVPLLLQRGNKGLGKWDHLQLQPVLKRRNSANTHHI